MSAEPAAAGQATTGGAQPPRSAWRRALGLLWELNPRMVVALAGVTLLSAAIPAATVQATTATVQAVADAVAAGPGDGRLRAPLLAAAVLAALAAANHLLDVVRGYVEVLLQHQLANRVNERIMVKALTLQLEHFEDAATYDSLQRATREAAYRPYQLFADLVSTLSNLLALLGIVVILLTWHPLLALMLLLAPLPAVASSLVFGRRGFEVEHERSADRRRATYLQLLLTTDRTYKEVRLFDVGPLLLHRFRELVERFYDVDRRLARRESIAAGLLGLLTVAAIAGALVYAVTVTVRTGEVGRLAGYLAALTVISTSTSALFTGLVQLFEHNLFLGNLFAFLDMRERRVPSGSRPFPEPLVQGIEFRDVSFTYPGAEVPALEHLDLLLPAGRCVAVVGANGAGKTTLVKLLARLYEPTSGEILLDGTPVEEYDLDDLRSHLGILFQDFVQYEASARDNIAFGRHSPDPGDAAVRRAAEEAGASAFLDQLPHGLDTQLGRWFEGGLQLSGGQWQKVALARAFLRGASVVVLDEPTASIDAQAESEVFSRLREIAGSATTLLIAHRFSTVRVADHIAVLAGGRVVEEGSHEQLVSRDGTYARLFRLQAAGYLDTPVATRG